jgi:uncharacterized pyridoxamine 5'-phosphate oxidase family protein
LHGSTADKYLIFHQMEQINQVSPFCMKVDEMQMVILVGELITNHQLNLAQMYIEEQ